MSETSNFLHLHCYQPFFKFFKQNYQLGREERFESDVILEYENNVVILVNHILEKIRIRTLIVIQIPSLRCNSKYTEGQLPLGALVIYPAHNLITNFTQLAQVNISFSIPKLTPLPSLIPSSVRPFHPF